MSKSDKEQEAIVAVACAAFVLLDDFIVNPVLRVYMTNTAETLLANDDSNFQRLFCVSRGLFDTLCHLLRSDLETWRFSCSILGFLLKLGSCHKDAVF